ncbi:outer membrane protein transport protein [Pedobacter sp. MC2016-14]|uniref:outer membrane protein transport protein n=1 Tax=Pedobacter sp. MC2016-14 TaxID=2897327 RepID=UPI001E34A7A4|nr:outer membrane protein transport protein [Pedobacter sp. MC2016-14]MCD0487559.1 outer membrane protein transport protein [Pedobacter sp. MC2016-14]
MKSLRLNMYKKINYIAAALVLITGVAAQAQVTTQSPYSRYGVGNIKGSILPQLRAMGGISTAIYRPNGSLSAYNTINMQNPSSYAGINLTTIDVGMTGGITELRNSSASESSFNSTLSHVALAFPITRRSALSFGIMPFSELGYQFENQTTLSTPSNPSSQVANYIYAGEGGITKAYIGYGIGLGDHFRIGANAEYLFGNLLQSRSTEFVDATAINSRMQNKNSVGGMSYSYGAQYDIPLGNKTSLTLGYSGSSSSKVNSRKSYVATQYFKDQTSGDELTAIDTLVFTENEKTNLKLPLLHNFGVVLQKDNKWLIGADYRMGKWSEFSIDNQNQGLQDTYGFSIGSQITPDVTSIGSYFKRVDYRLGFAYDKTSINLNNQDIKQMAITFGFGFPLAPSPSGLTFYKVNFTTELGKRGSISNGLLEERYINFHLGFTLNDKWFRRFKFQ